MGGAKAAAPGRKAAAAAARRSTSRSGDLSPMDGLDGEGLLLTAVDCGSGWGESERQKGAFRFQTAASVTFSVLSCAAGAASATAKSLSCVVYSRGPAAPIPLPTSLHLQLH